MDQGRGGREARKLVGIDERGKEGWSREAEEETRKEIGYGKKKYEIGKRKQAKYFKT